MNELDKYMGLTAKFKSDDDGCNQLQQEWAQTAGSLTVFTETKILSTKNQLQDCLDCAHRVCPDLDTDQLFYHLVLWISDISQNMYVIKTGIIMLP